MEDTALCLHLLLTSFGSCLSDACSEQCLPRSPRPGGGSPLCALPAV